MSLAASLAQRALDLDRKTFGNRSVEGARALELLAELARDRGQYAQAEPLLSSLITSKRKSLGENNPQVAGLMEELGECFYWEAKDDQAIEILRRTLAIDKQNGPNFGMGARNFLALTLERKGEYEEASASLGGGGRNRPAQVRRDQSGICHFAAQSWK